MTVTKIAITRAIGTTTGTGTRTGTERTTRRGRGTGIRTRMERERDRETRKGELTGRRKGAQKERRKEDHNGRRREEPKGRGKESGRRIRTVREFDLAREGDRPNADTKGSPTRIRRVTPVMARGRGTARSTGGQTRVPAAEDQALTADDLYPRDRWSGVWISRSQRRKRSVDNISGNTNTTTININ